ncbi:MAG: ferritin [Desulfomicrobium sp.]|jgi:ferritin|nr:ferritin [Desulfomicrobium sp.]NLV97796.1 ferritin [Desulfovibrionales bacterium]
MLSPKIEKALNAQINAELFSSYLYLAMVAYFQDTNLSGFAHWMTLQSQEETSHGMKFFQHIIERGGRVTLEVIDRPQFEWKSPLEAMEAALEHEIYITKRINDLVDLAMDEKDHATASFLQWFVDEQVEEEDNANGIVQKLRMIGDHPGGLFMLDRDMGSRA